MTWLRSGRECHYTSRANRHDAATFRCSRFAQPGRGDRDRGRPSIRCGHADPFIRAFDADTGNELWKAQLPASAHSTPMTYKLSPDGKQYLVIAAGGHPKVREEKQSDTLVAFALE